MLAARGYKTKKDLRACVGQTLRFTETSAFGPEFKANGLNYLVGPSAYERKWYAQVTCKDGFITKVQ